MEVGFRSVARVPPTRIKSAAEPPRAVRINSTSRAWGLARKLLAQMHHPYNLAARLKKFFPGLEATESEQILVRVIYLWIGWPYIVWADGWHDLYEVVMAVQVSGNGGSHASR